MKSSASARLLTFFWLLCCGVLAEVQAATEVVSLSTGGTPTSFFSQASSMDATGRYVTFESLAPQLVSDDSNFFKEVYLRDRVTRVTLRISAGPGGVEANAECGNPCISHDGRYVAYESIATNLVPGDTNGFKDIFVYDRVANKTTRVSVRSGGGQADNESYFPAISGDGRYVAFVSTATNLVDGDTNLLDDVFVHDRVTKKTTRVSVRSDGGQVTTPGGFSAFPSLSRDGRYVAFSSTSSDLVNGDVGGFGDVFVHDRTLKTTTLVSRNAAGVQANAFCNSQSLSADGRVVAFVSSASNLSGAGGNVQVYTKNLQTGAVSRVRPAATFSYSPSLSADGKRVALVTKVGAASEQVEVVDTTSSQIFQPARLPNGTDAGTSALPSLSADGRVVVFESAVNGIAAGDTNGVKDVLARPLFDTLGFTKIAYQSLEQNANVAVTVRRDGLVNGAVTATYSIGLPGDTAKPGVDYNPVLKSATLNWPAGDFADRTITIPLVNTTAADGYRLFTVSLTNPTGGAALGTAMTKVVIKDQESSPVEDRIGHRLQFKSIVARGTNWSNGLFRALFTFRNPSTRPSFPGFIELRFNGNLISTTFFDAVPARGELVVDATGSVGSFPDGDLFAILYETTPNGDVKQDSGFAAGYIDNGTAPPSGGTTQPSVGVKTGPPPVTVKTIVIAGPANVNEGTFGDYSATVTLSDNTVLDNVSPSWQTSAFSINGAGRLTAGDVAGDKSVTLTARVTHNGVTATKTRSIVVKNVPATPIITSSAAVFGTQGKPFTYKITARHEPTEFAATNLPDGLTLNTSTGVISGTPTVANTFNATMQAINGTGTDTDALTITISAPSPLTVNTVGTGSVTPDLNAQLLDVGRTYKLTAKPGTDQLFKGWSGGIVSEAPVLNFVMTPNLALTATFVTNPFLTRTGAYAGLVQSTPATHEAGGLFTAVVSKTGVCTGKLVLGGKSKSFKTLLKPDGSSPLVTLPPSNGIPITFSLNLDVVGNSGLITGSLTNGAVSAAISAEIKASDSSALAGRYTWVIVGPSMPSADGDVPDGSGFGMMMVSSKGTLKLAGVLADGTPFSQAAPLSNTLTWPLYAPLYAKTGSVQGFAVFNNQASSDFNAVLSWFKPARPTDAFYPAGWPAGLTLPFLAARYNPPPVLPGLGAETGTGNAALKLNGGGLIGGLTQGLNISTAGAAVRVAPLLPSSSFSLSAATGLFKGSFFDAGSGKVRSFAGAIQQKLQVGFGNFKGAQQRTGQVILGTP